MNQPDGRMAAALAAHRGQFGAAASQMESLNADMAEWRRLLRIRHIILALKEVRKKRGLTIDQVATACGVHKSVISRFENESTDPRMDTVLRYAEAVGTGFAVLIDGLEPGAEPFKGLYERKAQTGHGSVAEDPPPAGVDRNSR